MTKELHSKLCALLERFAAMHREGCKPDELACQRGCASDMTALFSGDFQEADALLKELKKEPEDHRIVYNNSESRGVVTIDEKGGFGPLITVKDGKTEWQFLLDLYYLTKMGQDSMKGRSGNGMKSRCVQIVAYNPKDLEGDPVQHLRVFPNGEVETFKC